MPHYRIEKQGQHWHIYDAEGAEIGRAESKRFAHIFVLSMRMLYAMKLAASAMPPGEARNTLEAAIDEAEGNEDI